MSTNVPITKIIAWTFTKDIAIILDVAFIFLS